MWYNKGMYKVEKKDKEENEYFSPEEDRGLQRRTHLNRQCMVNKT